VRYRLADRPHGREEVLVDGVLPVPLVQVLEGTGRRSAGVVHDDVQPPELLGRRRDRPLDVVVRGHVADGVLYLFAGLALNLLRGGRQVLLAARADHHACALAHQFSGDRLADSFARAADEGGAPVQAQVHRSSLPLCWHYRSGS
jgi:hypothetical protein